MVVHDIELYLPQRISSRGRQTYVHDAAVDVAKLLKAEQPRAMGGVIEGVALGKLAQVDSGMSVAQDRLTVVA